MKKLTTGTYEIKNEELGIKGFICVNSVSNGLAFGGCRISASVSREEVQELARCMTLKLAAHGLPVGGAKGGIQVSPTSPIAMKAIRSFGQLMRAPLSEGVILGKDLGASTEMLDAVYEGAGIDQLHVLKNGPHASRVPNKIREMNGYQTNMTGLGVATAGHRALKGRTAGKRAIIQGSGAVGYGTAVRLINLGGIITGISDVESAVFKSEGFSVADLSSFIKDGRIDRQKAEAVGATVHLSADLYKREADLLVLAAASHSVLAEHARSIACPSVVEGSNFGLVPEARTILFKRGVMVVPDVIASSSSAAMVAFQMQSRNGYTHEQLWKIILPNIENAVDKSLQKSLSERTDMRDAYAELFNPTDVAKAA